MRDKAINVCILLLALFSLVFVHSACEDYPVERTVLSESNFTIGGWRCFEHEYRSRSEGRLVTCRVLHCRQGLITLWCEERK